MASEDYLTLNRQAWDEKVPSHVASEFYDVPSFLAGKNTLNSIELELLGDVRGKKILHLQCHFGLDTLSLSRMGAIVTGVDFSHQAILKARELNEQLQLDARFIECDILSLDEKLTEQFDIVFTSYGTIGWLPDLKKWGKIVQQLLAPTGQFVFAEFHPVVWMYSDDFSIVAYSYFQKEDIIETTEGTYADNAAPIRNKTISWNHAMSEVVTVLLEEGLTLTNLKEYDYSPYSCFSAMEERKPGEYILRKFQGNIPMVYSLRAVKA